MDAHFAWSVFRKIIHSTTPHKFQPFGRTIFQIATRQKENYTTQIQRNANKIGLFEISDKSTLFHEHTQQHTCTC